MIRYVLWTVLFVVDIFKFLRIWFGCTYIYIYIYMREFVSHTVSLVCTHTRTRRGGGAEGQRDKGAEGHRGRRADGQRGGGAEGLGGGGTGGRRCGME